MAEAPRPPPYPADTRAKGWRFEIDLEKAKASDTWLRAKTGAMRGALLLLWAEAWQQSPCGTLPNDDELVALLIDMPAAAFAKQRHVLMRGWWLADDGRLYHAVVTDRVLEMIAKKTKDRQRKGAWRARQSDGVTPESRGTDVGLTPESRVSDDTKHQAPSTTEAKASDAPKRRAAKTCPSDFELTPELRHFAWENAPAIDIDRETLKFRNHTFKTARSDWPATWKNWMLEAADRKKPGGVQSFADQARNRMDALSGRAQKPQGRVIDAASESVDQRNIPANGTALWLEA